MAVRSGPKPSEPSDEEMVEELRQKMLAPGYRPQLAPPVVIGLMFGVSRQAVWNWTARAERTGVRSYDGLVNIDEVILWTAFTRKDDARTRRRVAS